MTDYGKWVAAQRAAIESRPMPEIVICTERWQQWEGEPPRMRSTTRFTRRPDDEPNAVPSTFIQWKGTRICMDVYCACGEHNHIDAGFAYYIKCLSCGRIYEVGTSVALRELTADEIPPMDAKTEDDHDPYYRE